MKVNLTIAKSMGEARSVMSAWREQRDTLTKARKRRGTNVDKAIKDNEKRLVSRVTSVFTKAKRQVMKTVRKELAKVNQALIDKILDDLDTDGVSIEVVEQLTATLKKVYSDAHSSAVGSVGLEDSGYNLQHADELAIQYADARAAELVTGISETTRDDLRMLIESGVGEGSSVADVAEAIESSFVFSSARAEMIARTELAYAHVGGNMQGWKDTGTVGQKQWVVGAGCCDECDELDGTVVDLDDTFSTSDGDIDGPPLHPNCRCDVIPIVKEQDEEEGD